jgi:hypothetical protein
MDDNTLNCYDALMKDALATILEQEAAVEPKEPKETDRVIANAHADTLQAFLSDCRPWIPHDLKLSLKLAIERLRE